MIRSTKYALGQYHKTDALDHVGKYQAVDTFDEAGTGRRQPATMLTSSTEKVLGKGK